MKSPPFIGDNVEQLVKEISQS